MPNPFAKPAPKCFGFASDIATVDLPEWSCRLGCGVGGHSAGVRPGGGSEDAKCERFMDRFVHVVQALTTLSTPLSNLGF